MNLTLSVIIPVYNCERFIRKAVESILQQPEVTEIVVVNDGSTDGTALLLDELQEQNSILKIYHHENKLNKGRSASRNLGIQKAAGNYIAFLDADDYFLPNRFTNDFLLFRENRNCDGVYNAVGFHYYRDPTDAEVKENKLYTVNTVLQSERLFIALLYGKHGHFHINGLTVKKNVFETVGFFNEALVVAEDTEMFWKMALKCRLITGIIKQAIAIRGVHDNNVFVNKELYATFTIKMFETLLQWCVTSQVSGTIKDELLKWIWILKEKQNNSLWSNCRYWSSLFVPQPQLFFSILSVKYFPLVRFRQVLFPFLYRNKLM